MDLRTLDTWVPAITARGAIVEKGRRRRKVIGDYLNSSPVFALPQTTVGAKLARDSGVTFNIDAECYTPYREQALLLHTVADQDFLAAALALTPRWRCASNRQTPVATETLRLLTLPAIGRFTR